MTTPPRQSYVIWFSQRVGSTVLTQTLEDTGIAGRPREWFTDNTGTGLLATYGVANAAELREAIWGLATTTNGVIGMKYGMRADLHDHVMSALRDGVPDDRDPDGRCTWDAFFPRCKHVVMTRRDKLRLAVSWWRAIKSEEWHRPNRAEPTGFDGPSGRARPRISAAALIEMYDYDAIEHLVIEAALREADIQDQLDRWGVTPYTVIYEDLIARYEPSIRALLEFLEIPGREGIAIPTPAFDQIADEVSEAWRQRYRREWEAKR